ncbi:ABC transporter substrate-binding protein [Alkalihalobacillus oceani]|uniref:ABC transporter substrate-binding protein n=1 Tax=Halalkalibacter oceani TaxID=1653776 RepID=UPI00203B3F51|nr:ABC transporter substrate-binding protein [Halalkalibacter oceani]MCM3760222.1 ABC transporter substrate-binding protein [Halalkalibacter oceani]
MKLNIVKCSGLLVSLVLLLAGCNQGEPATSEGESGQVIEIENNGITLEVSESPQRAVSLNQHVTEVMLALGLEDRMVGTAYLDDEILPGYKEAYEKVEVLSDTYPSKEVFLAVEPDFAYAGWPSAFREDSLGTQEELIEYGIIPYLHESSMKTAPRLEDIYTDIRHVAEIFQVEDRAEQFIAETDARIAELTADIPEVDEAARVFVFDSGDTTPKTAGQNFLNELISVAGGENIFSELEQHWPDVSWEEVVERDPEIIVIMDYGTTAADEKIDFLLENPMLTNTTAVQNQHFVVMPLSTAAEGVRIALALETLVEGFYDNE